MERAVVESALRNSIESCVGITDLDLEQSMKHYEISSLDNVEIVSMTTRSLKVKVPRAELLKAKNMSELVDVIFRAAQQ